MDHQKCQSLLADYAVMGLTQKMAIEVEAHLQECEVCSAHMHAQMDLIELGREFKGSLWPAKKHSWAAGVSAYVRSLGTALRHLAPIRMPVAAILLVGLLSYPLYLISVSIPSLEADLSQTSSQLKEAVARENMREGLPQTLQPTTRSRGNTIRLNGDVVKIRLAVAKPRAEEGWYVVEVRSADGLDLDLSLRIRSDVYMGLWDAVHGGVVLRLPTYAIGPGEHALTVQKEGDPKSRTFAFHAIRD